MPSHNKREFFPFVTAIFGEKEGNGGRKPIVKALVLLLLRDMIRQICTKACHYTTQGRTQCRFPFLYMGMLWNLGDSKTGMGVRMDGERIRKLSGQGSVYIKCIDPLEDEDKDEEDVQLTTPTFSQLSDDLSNNPVVTMFSPLQQPISQPQPLDQADPLLSVPVELPVEVPPFIDLWSDQSTHINNCDVVISNVVPTSPTCSDEVPAKIIRVIQVPH